MKSKRLLLSNDPFKEVVLPVEPMIRILKFVEIPDDIIIQVLKDLTKRWYVTTKNHIGRS